MKGPARLDLGPSRRRMPGETPPEVDFLVIKPLENYNWSKITEEGVQLLFRESLRDFAAACGPEHPELAPGSATMLFLADIAREVVEYTNFLTHQPSDRASPASRRMLYEGMVLTPLYEILHARIAMQDDGGRDSRAEGAGKKPLGVTAPKKPVDRMRPAPMPRGPGAAGAAAVNIATDGTRPKQARRRSPPATKPPAVPPPSTRSWAARAAAPPAASNSPEGGSAANRAGPADKTAPTKPPATGDNANIAPQQPRAGTGSTQTAQPLSPSTTNTAAPRKGRRTREPQPATRYVQVRGAPRPARKTRDGMTEYLRGLFKAAGFDAAAVEAIQEARERRGGQVFVLEFKSTASALRFMRGKAARLQALEPKVKIFLDFVAPPPTADPQSAEAKACAEAVASFLDQHGAAEGAAPESEEARAARGGKTRRRAGGASPATATATNSTESAASAPTTPQSEAGTDDRADDGADIAMDVEVDASEDADDAASGAEPRGPDLPLNGPGLAAAGGPSSDQRSTLLPEDEVDGSPRPRLTLLRRGRGSSGENNGPPTGPMPGPGSNQPPRGGAASHPPLRQRQSDSESGPPRKVQITAPPFGRTLLARETSAPTPFKTPAKGRGQPVDHESELARPPVLDLPDSPPARTNSPDQPSPLLLLSPSASEKLKSA